MNQPPFPTPEELTAPGDTMANRLRQYMIACWVAGGVSLENAKKMAGISTEVPTSRKDEGSDARDSANPAPRDQDQ
jgi:hypothetical protein